MSDFQKVWVMKALSDENNISWSNAVSYWNLNSYSIYRYIYRLPLGESIPDGTSITSEYWERLDTYDENLTLDLDVGYWILLEGIMDDLEDGQGTSLGGPKMNWKVEFKDFSGNSIYDGEEIRTDNYGFFNIPYNNLNHNGNLFEIYTSCVDSSGFDTLTKEQSIIGENFSAIGVPGTKYSQATALSSILATGLKESEESINIGSYESQKQKFETAFGININTNPYDTTTDVENANKFSSGALQMEILLSGMNNVFNDTSETEENIKIATMKAIANVISESSGKLDFTDENNFLKKVIEKSAENMNINDAETKNSLKDKSVGLYECVKYIKDTVESDVETESNDAILEMHKKLKAIKEKFKEESEINNIDESNLNDKKAYYESFFDNYDVPKYNPEPFRLNVKIIYGLYLDANGDKYTGTVNQPNENETEEDFEKSERYTQGSTRPTQALKDSVDIALDYIHGFLVGYNEKDIYGNETFASKDANELITIEQADLNSAGVAVARQKSIYIDEDYNEITIVSPARIVISNSVVERSQAVIDGSGEWYEDYYINDNKHNKMVMVIIHEILHTLGVGTTYDDFWPVPDATVTPPNNSYYPKLWRGDMSTNRVNYKFSMLEGRDGFYSLEDRNKAGYGQDAETLAGFGSLQWPDEWYIDPSGSWFDNVNNTHNGAWDFNDPSGNGSSATLMNEKAGKNRADDRRFYYTGKAGLREYKRLLTPRKPDGTVDTEHKMYWDGGRFAHWDGIITNPKTNDVAGFVNDDGEKIGVDDVINDMKNKKNHFDNLVGIPIEDNFGPGSGNLHFEKGLRGESTRMWNSYWDASGNPNAYMNVDEFKKKVQPVSLNHAILGRKDVMTGSNFPYTYPYASTAMPTDWTDLSGNNYNDDPDTPIGTVYDSRAVAAGLLNRNTKTYDGPPTWGLAGLKDYGLDLIDDVKQISAPNPLIHPVIPNDIMCYQTQRYSYITSMILGILEDRGYKIDYESDKYTNTGMHLDYIAETHDGRQTKDVRHDTDPADGNKTADGDAENASGDWMNDNHRKIDF
jgi:hypothetical protein